MNTKCHNCGKDHALFYFVGSNGKRKLSVICDSIIKLDSRGKSYKTIGRLETPDNKQDLPVPEQWSTGWAKKKQREKELQLPLRR